MDGLFGVPSFLLAHLLIFPLTFYLQAFFGSYNTDHTLAKKATLFIVFCGPQFEGLHGRANIALFLVVIGLVTRSDFLLSDSLHQFTIHMGLHWI